MKDRAERLPAGAFPQGWACPLCASVYAPQVVECERCNGPVPPMVVERRAIILWLKGKPEYTVVYYP